MAAKIGKGFFLFLKYLIGILFAVITLYLVYLAGFSTTAVSVSERAYLISDSFFKNLAAAACVVGAGCLVLLKSKRMTAWIRRVNEEKAYSDRCRRILLSVIGILAVLFVLLTQKTPTADQIKIVRVADALLKHDYSVLERGSYLKMNVNQSGIVLILYALGHLFGSRNYIAFQLFNAAALVLLYKGMADISDCAGHSRFEGLAVLFGCLLFLPGLFYTSFVYGTLIGLSASVNGVKHVLYFEKNGRIRDLIGYGLLMLGAVAVKNNYLIFLIGSLVYLAARFLRNRKWRLLLPVAISVVLLPGSTALVNGVITARTGKKVESGMSPWSYVAMGLQENEEHYSGWFNNYHYKTFKEHNYSRSAQERAAKKYIKKRAREFMDDPEMALKFFAGKNASQWNNPDYEGLWINRNHSSDTFEAPYFLRVLFDEKGSADCTDVLNPLQFLLFFGAMICAFSPGKRSDAALFYEVTVVGGFLFHTFWEAKPQYTFSYAALLIPLAVSGYRKLVSALVRLPSATRAGRIKLIAPLCAFLIGACVIRFGGAAVLDDLFLLNADTEDYMEYVSGRTYERLRNGNYRISIFIDGTEYGLSDGEKEKEDPRSKPLTLVAGEGKKTQIGMSELSDRFYARFLDDHRCLDVPDGQKGDHEKRVRAYPATRSENQQWAAHRSRAEGKINILYSRRWALTADPDTMTVSLTLFTDAENQQWILSEADSGE